MERNSKSPRDTYVKICMLFLISNIITFFAVGVYGLFYDIWPLQYYFGIFESILTLVFWGLIRTIVLNE